MIEKHKTWHNKSVISVFINEHINFPQARLLLVPSKPTIETTTELKAKQIEAKGNRAIGNQTLQAACGQTLF